jgi:Bacteriophage tail sheath protein
MSAEPTYPGVYIEEFPSGVRTIPGVSTCATGFAGFILREPLKEAVHVFGVADFERSFGDIGAANQLGSALEHYFLHGGRDAWVVRTAPSAGEMSSLAVLLHAELA